MKINSFSVIGPLVGILSGALSLSLWADINNADNITIDSSDENWIGAWWLPFFADGCVGLVFIWFMFGFPGQFPGAADIKKAR